MGRSQATKYASASGNRDPRRDHFTVRGGIDNPGAGTGRYCTDRREGGRGDTRSEAEADGSYGQASPAATPKPQSAPQTVTKPVPSSPFGKPAATGEPANTWDISQWID